MFEDFAPAKINLYLHILNRRADGYHELESLAVFADVGDRLTLDLSKSFALEITGQFAKECSEIESNSIVKAVRALQLRAPNLKLGAFTLKKNLPVAAGLGGGSADAAAALRLLAKANHIPQGDKILADAALYIGADVPICLQSKTALMRGVGEEVEPVAFPSCAAVLVNCSRPLLTRDVFAKFLLSGEKRKEGLSDLPGNFTGLISLLKNKTNDLDGAAKSLCPEIIKTERALMETGAVLVRLSGSGATVFGLYADKAQSEAAAQLLRRDNAAWWARAVTLG
jgi:4-diphosphocytidyl-2-C-methyl-D-erythritol kinase